MRTDRIPTSRPDGQTRTTPRGRRRSPTTRRTLLLESLEPRTLLSSGQLDPTFGYQGVVPIIGAPVEQIISDSEGRLLVAGANSMSRYNANGQLDTTFGSLGTVDVGADGVAVQPDGKIVAMTGGGSLTRLYSNGALDTTFGTNGVVQSPSFTVNGASASFVDGSFDNGITTGVQCATLPDGRVVVAGIVTDPTSSNQYGLAMYLPDGQLDTSFNGTGTLVVNSASSIVWGLAVTDNQILVLTSVGVTAYHFDGTLDSSFGVNGEASPTGVSYDDPSLVLLPAGRFLIGLRGGGLGYYAENEMLYRYNADGTPDTSFGTAGEVTLPGYYGPAFDTNIALQPNGKLIVTSETVNTNSADDSVYDPYLYRLNADGSLDTSFGDDGGTVVPIATANQFSSPALTTVQPNGRILVATGDSILYGIVGDPVVSFGGAASYSASSGTPLSSTQLDATANAAGTFSYSPPLGTVLQAGNDQKLSVTFAPTDTTDYTSATKTVYIDVENSNRSVPTITWANPAGITYGTPLSATQLDATASVSGTFSYSPSLGTILDAGNNQTLSVTFTPTDTVDYATASRSVAINVAQAQASLSFGNLSFTYDGLPQSTSITTSPVGLAGVSVKYTDNGLVVASLTAVGSYQVTASLDNPDYTAQPIMGTMTITQSTTQTATQTVIIGEQPFFQRMLNKKGKPTGKAVLGGFTLDFGVALNAAAGNAAMYQIDTVTTKKVKGKKETILHSIANVAVSYLAASDAVQLTLGSKQTFPTGGQITVLPGLTTASGGTLTGPAVFTIAKGGNARRAVVSSVFELGRQIERADLDGCLADASGWCQRAGDGNRDAPHTEREYPAGFRNLQAAAAGSALMAEGLERAPRPGLRVREVAVAHRTDQADRTDRTDRTRGPRCEGVH